MNLFFNPKRNIATLLHGFVDIHCHVLPGLDDGAKNMDATRSMLQTYHNMGVQKVIATPHILKGSYPNTGETIGAAFDKVLSEIGESIIYNASAEYMMDEDFETMLARKELLPLKHNYVLVEMSYFQKPLNLKELIFNLEQQGYIPVLAHPERYNFIKTIEEFQDLKKRGCRFQLNLLSLSAHYGPEIQKKASLLLKHDMYDFTATDAHHEKHLIKIAQISVSKKVFPKLKEIINNTVETFC